MFKFFRIGHVDRLLKEYPWLWAVKSKWTYAEKISVGFADAIGFLDWWISHSVEAGKSCCHVKLESAEASEIIRVDFDGIQNHFDVLYTLYAKGIDLGQVAYMVNVVGNEVRIYRAPKNTTFAQMFWTDSRAPKITD